MGNNPGKIQTAIQPADPLLRIEALLIEIRNLLLAIGRGQQQQTEIIKTFDRVDGAKLERAASASKTGGAE